MAITYHATGQQNCLSVEYETDISGVPQNIWLQRKVLRPLLTTKNWIMLGHGKVPATITITISS